MAKFTGGCLCGSIRYEADADPFASAACHCRECSKVLGGPSYVLVMPSASVRFTKGTPKGYTSAGGSGKPLTRYFCGDCGTALYAEGESLAGVKTLKAGTLDDPSVFKTAVHIWTSEKPHWVHIDPAAKTFNENPVM